MISIMELMEKKTPLIKNTDRKKGMTLVEVMAAMAILSILFVGISGMISTIIKSETQSNALLDNATIAKYILSMFEIVGDGSGDKQYISNSEFSKLIVDKESDYIEYKFNTIDNVINQIKEIDSNEEVRSDGDKYTLKIQVYPKQTSLYKITVEISDSISKQSQTKYMYIYIKL